MLHLFIIISIIIIRSTMAQDGRSFHSLQDKKSEVKNRPLEESKKLDRDALKRSVERNPFEIWYFKDVFKTLEDMFLTAELYNKQTVEKPPTTDRLQNVMTRALFGQNIGVTVMGGSISAGGGIVNDYPDLSGVYYRVFIDWWHKAVQPFTGSNIELRNLAVGGTGSNFFSYCYKTLMKPQDNMDMVFLEFSANDYVMFEDSLLPRALSLEILTRQLLSEESLPAVMFVNFISAVNFVPNCNNLENRGGQTLLAWHYGITSFSMRHSLCPNKANEKRTGMFSSDGGHPNIISHAQIAMMIIDNVRNTLLRTIESSKRKFHPLSMSLHDLQRPLFLTNTQEAVPDPLCYTLITPNMTDKFFNPSLSAKEIENIGFKQVLDEAIGIHKVNSQEHNTKPARTDGYGGWEAERENSTLKLQFDLPFAKNFGDNVTRSVVVAIRTSDQGGKAEIWLEKYKHGIVFDSNSSLGHTRLVTVTHHVTSGSHVLIIRLVKAGKFLVCGIMAGAAEYVSYR